MNKTTDYKYDVAFSLCQQDAAYAQEIVSQLNPGISKFFYPNNQEELISKSGVEKFGKVFKEEARIIVVLSRKEWGQSFYTGIERDAIYDRPLKEKRGFDFVMMIPMVPGEVPDWYPSTRIYADSKNFTPEQIARLIEFKIVDDGGVIKPITLEDRHQHLLQKIAEKKALIREQLSKDAHVAVQDEISKLYEGVQAKIELLCTFTELGQIARQMWPPPAFGAYFRVADHLLEVKVEIPNENYQRIVSCQDYRLQITLYTITGFIKELWEESENKKAVRSQEYRYLFNAVAKGWAVPFIYGKQISEKETEVLFRY